ncbi:MULTISPECIES: thioesterase family protein [Tsukamurella]|uniref:Thioesterase family protein n=2 Tax=Tsukamurella TaxID=2060 RepID=A0A5C5S0T0_9ACTN|nr:MULTISPECIES: thioesterase family protein [Tsukamurella]NMD54212.1 thioesterase family protein [Tsukamurella columbiensis]TWS28263.1 thioesterase family protein [Tsukamurella conjunctivitidis]
MADDAFFHPAGTLDADGFEYEVFDPTPSTASVWADTMQHGAPPAAIMVRAMEKLVGAGRRERSERARSAPSLAISRVTIDLLGVVPITRTRVRAWVARPGRTISLLAAEMDCADAGGEFRTVARAQAWALAASDTTAIARDLSPVLPPAGAEQGVMPGFFAHLKDQGFLAACDWRFVDGPDGPDGVKQCWIRARMPLVAGEEPSPLVQVFSVVDAANGISAYLDPTAVTWMNMDMTVHFHRSPQPVDGWIGLVGDQLVGNEGIGTTVSRLYDGAGAFAVGAQTLLVAAR